MMWLITITLVLVAISPESITGQSNYASQGNSIEYQPGLPPSTILDGKVTKLDELSPTISLNRTKAYLNCSQGSMLIDLKFEQPFYGIAYADFDRNSACVTRGRGLDQASLELPLKGCGTKQDPQRVFTNNIVVRFHPGLEMDGDEVITIICRYPPPVTPLPVLPGPIGPDSRGPVTEAVAPAPLKGFPILLTICALLFLSLLLLGLGCSYLCLKRRNVRVIHRHPLESPTGSEITKLSGSSLGNLSIFEGLRIPRAHAPLHATHSSSGSEANLVIDNSDTLPSDYPSESHSEVGIETTNAYGFEEVIHSSRSTTSLTPGLSQIDDIRSLPGSYDNKAFVHTEMREASSLYSETIADVETSATSAIASRVSVPRHPVAVPIEPKFDVQMRVKRAPPPPPSPLPSESDASIALERNLTTILEREETTRSIESPQPRMTTFSYVPELHGPPSSTISRQQTPPVYSRILRKQAERESHDVISSSPPMGPPTATIHRPRSSTTFNEFTETRTMTEVTDASHAKYRVANLLAPTPPPPPPIAPTHASIQQREHIREEVEPLVEPIVSPRRPEITTHEVDDVFLRTVTEKKTIEDIERHRRQVTEYRAKPKPDPKWDVTIRNYPTQELPPAPPQWENFSDVSSASNLTLVNEPIHSRHNLDDIDSTIQPTYSRAEMPSRSPHGLDTENNDDNWETLSRVLEPQYASELTEDDREKWREVITTESTLRTLLHEAVVKEDYELIRKDARYHTLFPPAKWDVIIRILSPPPVSIASSKSGQRYKRGKGSEWDSRSRRSSLPILYEYDSDDGTLIRSHDGPGMPSNSRERRLSSARDGRSDIDLRSVSETIRDFKMQRDDASISSYDTDSIVRSFSQPSLVRSGSELAETWGSNLRGWAPQEVKENVSSPETTPRAVRRGDRVEVMATFDSGTRQSPSGLTSTFARSTRYSERETVRVGQPQQQPRSSWFHDDDEPEMQI